MLARPLDEQRDAGIGFERRDRVAVLPVDPQQLAARDQEPERGCIAGQAGNDLGAIGEKLLEVVEDEQAGPVAQVRPERVLDWLLGRLADAERGRDHGLDPGGIADRGQVDEPRPVGECLAHIAGDRKRETGLAAAARSGQRDDPGRAQLVAHRGAFAVTADEARDLARQVRRHLGCAQRPSVVGGIGHDQSIDRERVLEVLDGAQAVGDQSDVGQRGYGVELAWQRGDQRLGEHDLSAVRGRRDPCRVVHVDADVVVGLAGVAYRAQATFAEVEAHPDPDDDAPIRRPRRRAPAAPRPRP